MKRMLANLLMIVFLIPGCDTQKFFGYNYDAEDFAQIASFTGTVTDVFSGYPIAGATIQIENQSAKTDNAGHYSFDYVLSEDASLGKITQITISAKNYLPYIEQRAILPESVPLTIALEYGAPIIEQTGCYNMTYCQAIIFDYQGAQDIDYVNAHFKYYAQNNTVTREIDVRLNLKSLSGNVGHFQAIVEPFGQLGDSLGRAYTIKAVDKFGFSASLLHINSIRNPDPLLFDPF